MLENKNRILVLGHRGAPLKEIENTLASFKRAILDGADGVELDVRVTKDHRLVVSHDNSLKRVYGVDLKVEDSTLDEIHKVAPEIPLLEDVFTSLGPICYDIEIKADQPIDYNKEVVTLLIQELEMHKEVTKNLVVSSFNPLAMRLFAKLTKNKYPMGIIYDGPPTSLPSIMRRGQGRFFFPCSFLKPKWDIAVREKKSKKKYPVCPWTVDTVDALWEMVKLNPPFIITNDSEKIVKTLREDIHR